MKERVPWQQLLVLFNIRPRKNSRLTTQCPSPSSSIFSSSISSVCTFPLLCKNRKHLIIVSEICCQILLVCQRDILDIPILSQTSNSPQQVAFRHVPIIIGGNTCSKSCKDMSACSGSNKKPAPKMSPMP